VKRRILESLPLNSAPAAETVYESTPRKPTFEIDDDEDDDDYDDAVEEEVSAFVGKNFGEPASL